MQRDQGLFSENENPQLDWDQLSLLILMLNVGKLIKYPVPDQNRLFAL